MKRFTILLFALAVGNSCYATNIEVGYTTGATSQTTTETLTGYNAPKDDEKTTDKNIDKGADKSPAKAADNPPTNAAERAAENLAEKSVGVSLEKSPVKADVKSDVHVGANKVGYWSWNVALTQATTQTTGYTPPTPQVGSAATSPNQTVTDHSQEEMAGLTYNWPSGADVGFSYTYNSPSPVWRKWQKMRNMFLLTIVNLVVLGIAEFAQAGTCIIDHEFSETLHSQFDGKSYRPVFYQCLDSYNQTVFAIRQMSMANGIYDLVVDAKSLETHLIAIACLTHCHQGRTIDPVMGSNYIDALDRST